MPVAWSSFCCLYFTPLLSPAAEREGEQLSCEASLACAASIPSVSAFRAVFLPCTKGLGCFSGNGILAEKLGAGVHPPDFSEFVVSPASDRQSLEPMLVPAPAPVIAPVSAPAFSEGIGDPGPPLFQFAPIGGLSTFLKNLLTVLIMSLFALFMRSPKLGGLIVSLTFRNAFIALGITLPSILTLPRVNNLPIKGASIGPATAPPIAPAPTPAIPPAKPAVPSGIVLINLLPIPSRPG